MNFQDIIRETFDSTNNAQKVNVVAGGIGQATVNINGSATIFAVVNTGAVGTQNSLVTLQASDKWIGLATVVTANAQANTGNVTLNPSPNFIGLTTSVIGNSMVTVTLGTKLDSTNDTVGLGSGTAWVGLMTVTTANAQANTGNVTLNPSPNFIGLNTSVIGNSMVTVTLGTKLDSTNDSVDIKSGATVFIGGPTLFAVVNTSAAGQASIVLDTGRQWIGLTTNTNAVAWPDPKTFIGLVTVVGSLSPAAGNVTLDPGSKTQIVGNLTLSDSKTFVGLTTSIIGNAPILGGSTNYIGLVTVANTVPVTFSGNVTLDVGSLVGVRGNLTLSDSKGYIGLVSANIGAIAAGANYIGLVSVSGSVGFSGNVTLDDGSLTGIVGNLTLSDSKTYIGLTTATIGNAPILGASTNYIGLVTVANTVSTTFSGNVTLDDGSLTGIVGNLTLSDSKNFIGLTTAVIGNAPILGASTNYIGLVTIANTVTTTHVGNMTLDAGSKTQIIGNLTLSDSKAYIGLVSVSHAAWANPNTFIGLVTSTHGFGNVTLNPSAAYIGLVTVSGTVGVTGNLTLSDPKTYIGLVTSTLGIGTQKIGLVTLNASDAWTGLNTVVSGAGTQFIGLVTAWTRNAGTAKTLAQLPIAFSLASLATIVVPTNAQAIYVTNMILSSDATVRIAIKSGATYLVGNASIGVTLFPGGGFVQNGSPDSPVYVGLASGSFNFEKQDIGTTVARIGGDLIYFQE